MQRISRSEIVNKAKQHSARLLHPSSKWHKMVSLWISELLQEEFDWMYHHFHSSSESDVPATVCRRKTRRVSEYVAFCRYMKVHQPEQSNLQHVWKQVKHQNWKARFSASNLQQQPVTTNEIPKSHQTQWSAVMKELKWLYDEDPVSTLDTIRAHNIFNQPHRVSSSSENSESCSDYDSVPYCPSPNPMSDTDLPR